MSVRGSNQDLRSQVKHYLDLEAKARVRWKKEMAVLAGLPDRSVELLAARRSAQDSATPCAPSAPQASRSPEQQEAFLAAPASAASRTEGASGEDAGAASGLHLANAIGDGKKNQPTVGKAGLAAEREAEKKRKEEYWINYWKERKFP
jgi:hypothetical protein